MIVFNRLTLKLFWSLNNFGPSPLPSLKSWNKDISWPLSNPTLKLIISNEWIFHKFWKKLFWKNRKRKTNWWLWKKPGLPWTINELLCLLWFFLLVNMNFDFTGKKCYFSPKMFWFTNIYFFSLRWKVSWKCYWNNQPWNFVLSEYQFGWWS